MYKELTIARFHEALRRGEISCEALVRAYLARIEVLDVWLKAVVTINPGALDEARTMDQGVGEICPLLPLYGVPVLLKDNIETADMPTTAGSNSLAGFQTGRDAEIVRRLKEAGAIILAKTNLHEFAIWGETVSSVLGQTLNPYDLTRTPGGSSGGTGAALAAHFGLVGIGTDTINSIRSPASACALCGIRPTASLVSDEGIVPYANTQDTAGPLARTVEDAVRLLDVIVGEESNRPVSYLGTLKPEGLRGKRIGVLESFFGGGEIHASVNRVMQTVFETLGASGAVLIPLSDEIDADWLVREVSVHLYELKDHLGAYLTETDAPVRSIDEILATGDYTPDIAENLNTANILGTHMPDYEIRLQRQAVLKREVRAIFERERLDAVVYPHQRRLVCKVGEGQVERNGVLASVIGFPAITVPGGYAVTDEHAPAGVPVGVEFLGRPYAEPTLIEIAYAFERASPRRRVPVLPLVLPAEMEPALSQMIAEAIETSEYAPESLAPLICALPHNAHSAFLEPRVKHLREALRLRWAADWETVGRDIAGCGPGATPASDDLLIGVLAVLQFDPVLQGEAVPGIVQGALPHTTAVSRAYLKAAGEGRFHPAVESLFAASGREAVIRAARELAEQGATSGLDLLTGIFLGLEAICTDF